MLQRPAALFAGAWLVISGSIADAAPCLRVTLTGTHGGAATTRSFLAGRLARRMGSLRSTHPSAL
jgi:hypothetical protein